LNYIKIGKFINTHGIKGEIRILSSFEFKEKIFIKEFNLYLGDCKEKFKIFKFRKHKNFDMVVFYDINNINDILKYKGDDVYILKEDLVLEKSEYLSNDLIGMNVFSNDLLRGKVIGIEKTKNSKLIRINTNKLIPINDYFIKNVNFNSKKITVLNLEGLFDED